MVPVDPRAAIFGDIDQMVDTERGERWRSILGYEGIYEVSSLGTVRSLDREESWSYGANRFRSGRVMTPAHATNGYLVIKLRKNGQRQQRVVHRLVAEAFIEIPVSLMRPEVNHKNGLKQDNRVENLEWVSSSQNTRHALATGLMSVRRGESHHASKLTAIQVEEIRDAYGKGAKQADLAHQFGVNQTAISKIIRRTRWA